MAFSLTRYEKNPILTPDPTKKWESGGVFNCSVVKDGDVFRMLYRAVDSKGKSRIGLANSTDGVHFKKRTKPFFEPEYEWEKTGCEDPRIVKLQNKFYITYSAVDGSSAVPISKWRVRIALATTREFKQVTKLGVIGPSHWSKAAVIIPEKINGKQILLFTWVDWSNRKDALFNGSHRYPTSTIHKTEFSSIKELQKSAYWKRFEKSREHSRLSLPRNTEFKETEIGAPIVKTPHGWLLIYSGINEVKKIWTIQAALLDLKNPQKVLAYSPEPILKPEKNYEKRGVVPNVDFPSGTVIVGDELYVYYGSADKVCCLATCKLKDLLASLKKV